MQKNLKKFFVKYKLEKLKEFFTEKLAKNMFGKKVGENRLATRKISGKNKIVEKIL